MWLNYCFVLCLPWLFVCFVLIVVCYLVVCALIVWRYIAAYLVLNWLLGVFVLDLVVVGLPFGFASVLLVSSVLKFGLCIGSLFGSTGPPVVICCLLIFSLFVCIACGVVSLDYDCLVRLGGIHVCCGGLLLFVCIICFMAWLVVVAICVVLRLLRLLCVVLICVGYFALLRVDCSYISCFLG